ncbi:hypothetical protein B0T18DRAFT_87862 [Schizothecium vesticola]|uniref:Uncharacterized protein n=1 Tax=Schizothecium vesticola TaxID=314040 RepID=A0AA40F6S9_9PEZI|nr:hypothetical protein B0T18DRAFT_87862 [Schizothecium vesticola]
MSWIERHDHPHGAGRAGRCVLWLFLLAPRPMDLEAPSLHCSPPLNRDMHADQVHHPIARVGFRAHFACLCPGERPRAWVRFVMVAWLLDRGSDLGSEIARDIRDRSLISDLVRDRSDQMRRAALGAARLAKLSKGGGLETVGENTGDVKKCKKKVKL